MVFGFLQHVQKSAESESWMLIYKHQNKGMSDALSKPSQWSSESFKYFSKWQPVWSNNFIHACSVLLPWYRISNRLTFPVLTALLPVQVWLDKKKVHKVECFFPGCPSCIAFSSYHLTIKSLTNGNIVRLPS